MPSPNIYIYEFCLSWSSQYCFRLLVSSFSPPHTLTNHTHTCYIFPQSTLAPHTCFHLLSCSTERLLVLPKAPTPNQESAPPCLTTCSPFSERLWHCPAYPRSLYYSQIHWSTMLISPLLPCLLTHSESSWHTLVATAAPAHDNQTSSTEQRKLKKTKKRGQADAA